MNQHSEITTDFTVYDGRKHVLGASMLAAADEGLRSLVGAPADTVFAVKRAKFTNKTGCNGRILMTEGAVPPVDDESAAAVIVGKMADRPVAASFVPESGAIPNHAAPSGNDLSDFRSDDTFGGSVRIRATGLEPVLRSIVDANKHIQLKGRAIAEVFGTETPVTELIYWENLDISWKIASFDTVIHVENLSSRVASDRLFTLNRIRFTLADGTSSASRMALSFHKRT